MPSTRRSNLPTLRPARPRADVHDVTEEIAAFSGRGVNGRPQSVTEAARRMLPRPINADLTGERFDNRADVQAAPPPSGFDLFAQGGSDGLAAAVREQESAEERRQAEKLRRAQDDYARYMESRTSAPPNSVEPFEIKEVEEVEPSELTQDEARAALEQEARQVASRIKSQPKPRAAASPVVSREVVNDDVDRLWDWIRGDDDRGLSFLGSVLRTSRELYSLLSTIVGSPIAAIRAIDLNGTHVGFLMLKPIDPPTRTAMLHIYLAPSMRSDFTNLFPYILSGARSFVDQKYSLVIHQQRLDAGLATLFHYYGFTSHTVFVLKGS